MFKFKSGDNLKSVDYKDNDEFKRQSHGKVLWLEKEGQFALEIDRSKHGLKSWIRKIVDWENWTLA